MLKIDLDKKASTLILEPKEAFQCKDFEEVTKLVDPFIQSSGQLKGIIIYVKDFHGWDSFSALVRHLKFIKNHHKKVSHIAFVTDSLIGDLAEHMGSHFVQAQVKHFPFTHLKEVKQWIHEPRV